jgi:DNA polymerase-3 subunit epsilon
MKMILRKLKNHYHVRRLRRKDLPPVVRDYVQSFRHLDVEKPISDTDFIVFDIEMTGFKAKKGDRILSISGLRLRNGRIDLSDVFHEMVNPDRDIPSKTAVIHEILPRMVEGKPMIDEILPHFLKYIGTAILVAHHEWLDMSFLNREMKRLYGFPIQNLVIDTAILDRAFVLMKTPPSQRETIEINSTLDSVADRYKISVEERHSSFWDAMATAQIFQKMVKEAETLGIVNLKDLLKLAFKPPSLGPEKPGHFI